MSDNNQNILLNVLQTQGGLNGNSLIDILGAMHTEDEEPIIFENSVYLDNQALIDALRSKQNVFKVLSLNCQSLYAKFDQLIVYLNMIQEEDCYFDAICLQETWVSSSSDISTLYINGYELISKHFMCSSHGGLAIYLKECYQYKRLFTYEGNFTSWEQQFIEVLVNERTKSKLVIGNIYRLIENQTRWCFKLWAQGADFIRHNTMRQQDTQTGKHEFIQMDSSCSVDIQRELAQLATIPEQRRRWKG